MSERMKVNRRDFLRTAGLAAGVGMAMHAAALGQTESKPPSGQWRIRKTLKYGMVQGDAPMLEKFKMLKELGFDGVEMDAPNKFDLKEVLEARDKSGLVINGLVHATHWTEPLSHPDPKVRAACLEKLKEALRTAKAYGATSVLLVPAVVNAEIGYQEAYERSLIEIRKAIPVAEETGVVIAFENVWNNFLLSPVEAARYVDEFESPMIRFHFDIGNVLRYGWPEHWVRTLGKRIFKLDTKGFSSKKHLEQGPWKGFGVEIGAPDDDVNYTAVNKALREVGYTDGWIAAEVKGGDRERLADISRRLDDVLSR